MATFGTVTRTTIACAAMLGIPAGYAQVWKPERPVEFVVSVGAGGALDRTARLIQRIWQNHKTLEVPNSVLNKPGGGGGIALSYLNQHAGDGHYLSIISPTLVSSQVLGVIPNALDEITPLAMLMQEHLVVAVKSDGPIQSGRQLIEHVLRDPEALVFGVATARGNMNHIAFASVVKAAGGDIRRIKTVVFDSGGKLATALMGGHVDVSATNASNVVPQVRARKLRILGVISASRAAGDLASVPTWREQGVNAVATSFRGIMGPKGLGRAQIAYWERQLALLAQDPEWRAEVEQSYALPKFLDNKQSVAFLKAQAERMAAALKELGLIK